VDTAVRPDGLVTIEVGSARRRGRLTPTPVPAGKADLAAFVARDLDTSRTDAKLIVDSVARAIAALAAERQLVRVPHLGNFRVLVTGARVGRNPRTGEEVPIAPGRRLTFRAAHSLKTGLARKRGRG
jgi:integration host factor subunit alpha